MRLVPLAKHALFCIRNKSHTGIYISHTHIFGFQTCVKSTTMPTFSHITMHIARMFFLDKKCNSVNMVHMSAKCCVEKYGSNDLVQSSVQEWSWDIECASGPPHPIATQVSSVDKHDSLIPALQCNNSKNTV